MSDDDSFTGDPQHDAVLSGLWAAGVDARWEYPGICVVPLDATHEAWTGLHSYEYGSLVVLVTQPDGTTFADDGGEAVPTEGLPEDTDDTPADQIVAAWVAAIATWRNRDRTP